MIAKKPLVYPSISTLRIRMRRGIPHFELDEGIYFITFRLADSLPRDVTERLRREYSRFMIRNDLTPMEYAEIAAQFGKRYDSELDRNAGKCSLRDPRAAELLKLAFEYHSGRYYELGSWSVMPNHIHVLLRLFRGSDLARVLHSWKTFTARRINELNSSSGRFWQREYYDRIVRDERELFAVNEYIVNNPSAAGMIDWAYVSNRMLTGE